MKKRNLLVGITALALSAGCFWACDKGQPEEKTTDATGTTGTAQSGIVARGITDQISAQEENPITFTDRNIAWFNSATREIRFQEIDLVDVLEPYRQIAFELDGEPLFTAATIVSPVDNQTICDLVLYVEYDNGWSFYLHDGYPLWAGDTELGRANAEKRAEGWNRFLDHLKADGRLIETADDDPGEKANPLGMPCRNTGDIDLTLMETNSEWKWRNAVGYNTLHVVRSEDMLKSFITDQSYTPSEVDFSVYTLLLVRINTPNGIQSIEYGLTGGGDTFAYAVTADLNLTDECPTVILPMLVSDLPAEAEVSFLFKTANGRDAGDLPSIPGPPSYDKGEIPLERFVPETGWKWTGVGENRLCVIRSEMELEQRTEPETYTPSGLDFGKCTLLLSRVCTGQGVSEITYALDGNGTEYTYALKVLLNEATVCENIYIATLAPALAPDAQVSYSIEMTDQF